MQDLSIYHQNNLLYTQESVSKYRPGGFHPVCLGDTFQDGHYQIHHKLGWGGFSTVWLAKDNERMQWVSIKIMTADSTKHSHELSILRSLATYSQEKICSQHIVHFLDEFLHQGPNGIHQCLVFELLGPTLDMIVSDYYTCGDPLEPETILRLSEQLLQAIAFLHEVGFVHGDISSRNVAFTCNGLSRMTEECLFEVLGSPETAEVTRLDGKPISESLPSQLVKAADWITWIDEDDEDLRIIDLGEAFPKGAEIKDLAQPGSLQAPETIFPSSLDHRLDLWRAGIVIYSLIFGGLPFCQWLGGLADLRGHDFIVRQMIGFVEELPMEWQKQWIHIQQNSGVLREPLIWNSRSSPSRLERKFEEEVLEETLQPILPVIQGLMRFRPADRVSVFQALDLLRSNPNKRKKVEGTNDEDA